MPIYQIKGKYIYFPDDPKDRKKRLNRMTTSQLVDLCIRFHKTGLKKILVEYLATK